MLGSSLRIERSLISSSLHDTIHVSITPRPTANSTAGPRVASNSGLTDMCRPSGPSGGAANWPRRCSSRSSSSFIDGWRITSRSKPDFFMAFSDCSFADTSSWAAPKAASASRHASMATLYAFLDAWMCSASSFSDLSAALRCSSRVCTLSMSYFSLLFVVPWTAAIALSYSLA